jgi:hypothetical protein
MLPGVIMQSSLIVRTRALSSAVAVVHGDRRRHSALEIW